MEEIIVTTEPDEREMKLDINDRQNILTAARWAKFLAILGFIVLGIMALFLLLMLLGLSAAGTTLPGMEAFGANMPKIISGTIALLIVTIVVLLIEFYPLFFMYRFAERAIKAVENNNGVLMSESFLNLRRYFKFVGILTVIVLALYLLAIVISLIAGMGAAWCMQG